MFKIIDKIVIKMILLLLELVKFIILQSDEKMAGIYKSIYVGWP